MKGGDADLDIACCDAVAAFSHIAVPRFPVPGAGFEPVSAPGEER